MEKRVKIALGITIAGVVLLLLGTILGWVVLPYVIKIMIEKEAQLTEGTLIYENWKDIPLPIHFSMYLWQVKNVEDYANGDWSAKPIMEEVGPYVYRETRVKYDITPHPDRDTISYRQNISYTFVPEMSAGLETDTVDLLNAPLIAVAAIIYTIPAENLPLPHKSLMELIMGPLSGEDFIRKGVSIRDAAFGVRLNFVYNIILYVVEFVLKIKLPPELQIVNGRAYYAFAPFVNKNGTNADGLWEVYSGVKDKEKINSIRTVNGNETLGNLWKTEECNRFKGGDGIFFAPFVEKEDRLWVYATEVCRSVWAAYERESEFEGIPTYRFAATKELFAHPDEFPENDCYCVKPRLPLEETCAPSGVLRLRACKTGAPVVLSKPHFLESSEFVSNGVFGMNPNKEKHDTFLDLEPTLGVPLRGIKRIQINVETQLFDKVEMGDKFNTLSNRYWPFLWAEEGAELNDELLQKLKRMYVLPLRIATIGKWVAVGLGIVGTIGGTIALVYFLWLKRNDKYLLKD